MDSSKFDKIIPYFFHNGGVTLHILVYVDDLIISGNSSSNIQEFKDYLSTCFHMKDLGLAKYFLGLEIARSSTEIYICEHKYMIDILSEVVMLGYKPVGSPIDQNHRLSLSKSLLLSDPAQY